MRRIKLLIVIAFAIFAVAGCGGGTSSTTSTTTTGPRPLPTVTQACPPGRSQMGCAARTVPRLAQVLRHLGPPSGGLLPDVSVWQGQVNWPAVAAWQHSHGWRTAGIFKMGEYVLDSQAARNASETLRLGMWRAGYWFLRATGCSHELALIVSAAHAYALRVVVLDSEVPEARGYVACLAPALQHAGFAVVEYTAPGTNPDGSSHPAGVATWAAAYGSVRPCLPWTCAIVAWQFTDGKYGAPVYVPGVGQDDVSVDLGLTSISPSPSTRLVCFGQHAQLSDATCKRVRGQVGGWSRARDASQRVYDRRGCPTLAQRDGFFSRALSDRSARGRALLARHQAALAATRRAESERHCSLFKGRADLFGRLAHSTFERYV